MKFARETLADVRGEIEPLFKRHWEDIALNRDKIALAPNWPAYRALEEADVLRIFTARLAGRLVGYFFLIVSPSLHYRDHRFAVADMIYLLPEARKGLAGFTLLRRAKESITPEGASLMVVNTKNHQPFDLLLRRLDFKPTETIHTATLI